MLNPASPLLQNLTRSLKIFTSETSSLHYAALSDQLDALETLMVTDVSSLQGMCTKIQDGLLNVTKAVDSQSGRTPPSLSCPAPNLAPLISRQNLILTAQQDSQAQISNVLEELRDICPACHCPPPANLTALVMGLEDLDVTTELLGLNLTDLHSVVVEQAKAVAKLNNVLLTPACDQLDIEFRTFPSSYCYNFSLNQSPVHICYSASLSFLDGIVASITYLELVVQHHALATSILGTDKKII